MEATLITGGRVIDPSNGVDSVTDLLIQNGRILEIGDRNGFQFGLEGATKIIDASGCVVTPGLIDLHVHAYQHATPLGINIDEQCLSRGVTTAVDAGSAGCSTLNGLRKFIRDQSRCRLYAFVHIASHGLASAGCAGLHDGGELDSLNQVDVQGCVTSVLNNRDFVVGIKLRLTASIADKGRNEQEAYRRAIQAARQAGVPLMVHHNISTVPTISTPGVLSCPGNLGAGDIFTHTFHWHKGNIVSNETGRVYPDVWEAKRSGVLFDLGHGAGSFGWSIAEACTKEGFWPDVVSTDLHTQSLEGPAYDLTTIMTRMLYLGMPLTDIVAATTSKPAAIIGKSDEIGSLKIGNEADVSILRLEKCDVELEDSKGETRTITERFVPVQVFRAGLEHPITDLTPWPSLASKERCLTSARQYADYAQSKQQQ